MKWTDGQLLAPITKPAITREQLRAYAEASLDHNRIHLDEQFAREAGFPSVIVHGMLSMAFLADFVCHHFPGDRFRLMKMASRFKKVTFPGDVLTCSGEVKKVNDNKILEISFRASNQRNEVVTEGTALISQRA